MFLRDLAVFASDAAKMPRGWTHNDFNRTTHAPVEAYLDRLPRRKIVLGDLAKVNVVIGPRPPTEKPYFAALHVAIIYWPRFDFGRYFSLSRAEQQLRIATALNQALLRIAKRTRSAAGPFRTAFASLSRAPLPLPELTEFELRRRWGLLLPREKRRRKSRAKTARPMPEQGPPRRRPGR